MKKIYFFVAVALCFAFGTKLQAQTYNFTKTTASYSNLTNANSVNMGMVWDDPSFSIPMSFPFEYFGTNIDSIHLDYGMGGMLIMDLDTINASASFLVVDGSDLIDRGYNSFSSLSPISYKVSGTSGNRILKIEWKNAGFYSELMDNNISSDYVNFQLWLYEVDNSFEIHYGPTSVSQPLISYEGFTGTNIAMVPEINMSTGTPNNSWFNLHSNVNNPTYSVRLPSDTIIPFNSVIPNGTVYRFAPTVVGLEETKVHSNEVFISPNPASDLISISNVDEMEISSLKIFNVKGQEVKNFDSAPHNMDVSELESGIYLLQIHSNKGMKQLKFVKE